MNLIWLIEGSDDYFEVLGDKINPTDEFGTPHHTQSKVEVTATISDKISAKFVWFLSCLLWLSSFAYWGKNGRLKTFICALLSLLSHDQLDWHKIFLTKIKMCGFKCVKNFIIITSELRSSWEMIETLRTGDNSNGPVWEAECNRNLRIAEE